MIAAVALRSDGGGGGGTNATEARYQRQAVATCTAVRALVRCSTLGVPGPNLTVDRSAILTAGRANVAAIDNRIGLLIDRPVPKDLRDEAATLRIRTKAFVADSHAALRALESSLPPNPTIDQLQAAVAPLQERADRDKARLEDAPGSLADHDCSL